MGHCNVIPNGALARAEWTSDCWRLAMQHKQYGRTGDRDPADRTKPTWSAAQASDNAACRLHNSHRL
jgi:hypothetical protein